MITAFPIEPGEWANLQIAYRRAIGPVEYQRAFGCPQRPIHPEERVYVVHRHVPGSGRFDRVGWYTALWDVQEPIVWIGVGLWPEFQGRGLAQELAEYIKRQMARQTTAQYLGYKVLSTNPHKPSGEPRGFLIYPDGVAYDIWLVPING